MSVLSRKVLSFKLHSSLFVAGTTVGDTVPAPHKNYDWKGETHPEGIFFEITGKGNVLIPWANVQYASLGDTLPSQDKPVQKK